MKKHAIDWFEIPVTEPERARLFYEAIFQVELMPMDLANGLKLMVFPADPKEGVSGALAHFPEFYKPSADGTLVYLNADPDLEEVLNRIEGAGGKVLVAKTQISPEHGYMAVFTDTEGNRVGLHSKG